MMPPTRDLQVVGPRFNPPINFTFIALDFTTTYTKVKSPPPQKTKKGHRGVRVVLVACARPLYFRDSSSQKLDLFRPAAHWAAVSSSFR